MKTTKLFASLLTVTLFANGLRAETPEPNQIIRLSDLNERVVQDFVQGNLGDFFVVECTEGAYLPLKLNLSGEFLSLIAESSSPIYIKVMKTCYIRSDGQMNFLFSTDLKNWKNFSEFFKGELNASVLPTDQGPIAQLHFDLNQR